MRPESLVRIRKKSIDVHILITSSGIYNGMMIGGARELCPDLVAVPYEFEKYEKVSCLVVL